LGEGREGNNLTPGIALMKRNIFFAAPFLVGSWFGTGQPDDRGSMWLIHQMADGTFQVQFRSCVKGKDLDEVETGRWQLNGDTETLFIQTVNGQRAAQADDYKILWHDGGKQIYRFTGTGFVYSSKRVDANFVLPSCETIS
jgi:hypothetical protein